jgi:hypothetical protein
LSYIRANRSAQVPTRFPSSVPVHPRFGIHGRVILGKTQCGRRSSRASCSSPGAWPSLAPGPVDSHPQRYQSRRSSPQISHVPPNRAHLSNPPAINAKDFPIMKEKHRISGFSSTITAPPRTGAGAVGTYVAKSDGSSRMRPQPAPKERRQRRQRRHCGPRRPPRRCGPRHCAPTLRPDTAPRRCARRSAPAARSPQPAGAAVAHAPSQAGNMPEPARHPCVTNHP